MVQDEGVTTPCHVVFKHNEIIWNQYARARSVPIFDLAATELNLIDRSNVCVATCATELVTNEIRYSDRLKKARVPAQKS